MKTYTFKGYEIALPDIPEGATDLELHDGSDPHITYKVGMGTEDFDILRESVLPGDWQLIKLSEVPEELAVEMVDNYEDSNDSSYDPMYNVTTYFTVYEDYLNGDDFDTAHASLTSWVRAQGVEGNPYLLIKKN